MNQTLLGRPFESHQAVRRVADRWLVRRCLFRLSGDLTPGSLSEVFRGFRSVAAGALFRFSGFRPASQARLRSSFVLGICLTASAGFWRVRDAV